MMSLSSYTVGEPQIVPTSGVVEYHTDRFDDDSNISHIDGCKIVNGAVFINDTIWSDDFGRTSIDPWVEVDPKGEGSVSIAGGALKVIAGTSSGASVWAEKEVDLQELRVEVSVLTEAISVEGFKIMLLFGPDDGLGLAYNNLEKELWFFTKVSGSYHVLDVEDYDLTIGNRYNVALEITRGGWVRAVFHGRVMGAKLDLRDNITLIRIGTEDNGIVIFDDLAVRVPYQEGEIVSKVISLPSGNRWVNLHVLRYLPEHTGALVDLLDARNDLPIPGYQGIDSDLTRLIDVDAIAHPSVKIRVRMHASRFIGVYISSWSISWIDDNPEWTESFEDRSNVSLTGDVEIENGVLRTTNLLVSDDFERVAIDPWTSGAGSPMIFDGTLYNDGTGSGYCRADREVDVKGSFCLTLSLAIVKQGIGGPCINLTFGSGDHLAISYHDRIRQIRLVHFNGSEHTLAVEQGHMSHQVWEKVRIEFNGTGFSFDFAWKTINTSMSFDAGLRRVSVSNYNNEDIKWDDLAIATKSAAGEAIIGPIVPPEGMGWTGISLMPIRPPGTTFSYSMLDDETLEPIPGHENMTDWMETLIKLHPRDFPKLAISMKLSGEYQAVCEVLWCEITFASAVDEVRHTGAIRSIHMKEDTPLKGVLNVTHFFTARYTDPEDLKYNLTAISDPDHVLPYLDGFELCIDLPEPDWSGSAFFRINCSSPEHSIEIYPIWVYVEPVNDPPIVMGPLEFNATEDALSVLNLTSYITDVDDPVETLGILCRNGNCTTKGLELHFMFERGGFDLLINLEVADSQTRVIAQLIVHVLEVNDPPIIEDIPAMVLLEGFEELVDMTPFIHDEDNGWQDLVAECDDSAVTDISGLFITFIFDRPSEGHTISFTVSDGAASTQGTLIIIVENTNDPPEILSIGGYEPTYGFIIPEGVEVWLDILVEDEDGDIIEYWMESLLYHSFIFQNGTMRILASQESIGVFPVTLWVTDPSGAKNLVEFTIEVIDINDPPLVPVLVSPLNGSHVMEGENVTFKVIVSDPDRSLGQVLSVTWLSNISGPLRTLTTDDELYFTTDELPAGTHLIEVSVTDGEFVRSTWFELTVDKEPAPQPPEPEEPPDDPTAGNLLLSAIIVALVLVLIIFVVWTLRSKGTR